MLSPEGKIEGADSSTRGLPRVSSGLGDELLRQALAHTDDPVRQAEIVVLRARSAIERGDQALVAQLVRDESGAVREENRMAGALLLSLGAAAAWSAGNFDQMSDLATESMTLVEGPDELSGAAILPFALALLASVIAGRPGYGARQPMCPR